MVTAAVLARSLFQVLPACATPRSSLFFCADMRHHRPPFAEADRGGQGDGDATDAAPAPFPAADRVRHRQRQWPLLARSIAEVFLIVLAAGASLGRGARGSNPGRSVRPFPQGSFPLVGRLHRACSLQCHMGPLANGDTSFEAGGIRYPWGDNTCRSSLDTMRAIYLSPEDKDGSKGIDLQEFAVRARVKELAGTLGAHRGRQIALDVQYLPRGPLIRRVCDGEGSLVREEDVVNVLSLLRNSIQGGVLRKVGKYDVVGYTRISVGVCGTDDCADVSAVDTTGYHNCGAVCVQGGGCSCQGTTVLTTVGPDGQERSISMMQHRYLSLGRGLLAQTDWFGTHQDLWNLSSLLVLYSGWDTLGGTLPQLRQPAMYKMIASLSGVPGDRIPAEVFNSTFLPKLTNATTTWPQMLAAVVCMEPMGSFVRDRSLCDGIPSSKITYQSSTLAGVRFFGEDKEFPMTQGWFRWVVKARIHSDSPIFNATPALFRSSPYERSSAGPAVEPLAAYGLREVHSSSPNEQAIASSVRRRLLYLPSMRGDTTTSSEALFGRIARRLHTDVDRDIKRLSSAYDRSVFEKDEPQDPATAQDVVLAVLVILPEASALAVALFTTRFWRCRECIAVGLIFAVGLASLSAIISLAITEHRGAAWRASSIRTSVGARFPIGIDNSTLADVVVVLTGTELSYAETFLITARTGYHPTLLLWLAVGFSAAYVVCAAGSFAYIVHARRRDNEMRAQNAETTAFDADDRVSVRSIRRRNPWRRPWWRPRWHRGTSPRPQRKMDEAVAAGPPADAPVAGWL